MNVIQRLIAEGRDPLEAVLTPPAPDVAEWLEEDRISNIDSKISRELSMWPDEWRDRLRQLIEERARKIAQEHKA